MKVRFADEKLVQLFIDAQARARFPHGVIKSFRRLVHYIQQAVDERDFHNMKSLHYERLGGDERSMRLNDQYRLILRLVGQAPRRTVTVVRIEDYH
ncbi:MAG TPA: type II toxin-antitoxin system RelE/ParE family toxin [Bacillota bacterium]|jgi:proteic killer suppression protein